MLSSVVARHPRDWRFATNAHGKPDLVRDAGFPPLRFNISHTRGLVAVALTIETMSGSTIKCSDAGREHGRGTAVLRCAGSGLSTSASSRPADGILFTLDVEGGLYQGGRARVFGPA